MHISKTEIHNSVTDMKIMATGVKFHKGDKRQQAWKKKRVSERGRFLPKGFPTILTGSCGDGQTGRGECSTSQLSWQTSTVSWALEGNIAEKWEARCAGKSDGKTERQTWRRTAQTEQTEPTQSSPSIGKQTSIHNVLLSPRSNLWAIYEQYIKFILIQHYERTTQYLYCKSCYMGIF